MFSKSIAPAFGYWLVALSCGIAGYSIAQKTRTFLVEEMLLLLLMVSFLFPIYLNRAILFDLPKQKTEKAGEYHPETIFTWNINTLLSLLVFVALLIACIPFFIVIYRDFTHSEGAIYSVVLKMIVALTPAYVVSIWCNIRRQHKDERIYTFRYRSFFPALMTCIPTFIFGWSSATDFQNATYASSFLIVVWGISLRLPLSKLTVFLLSLFLIVIVLAAAFGIGIISLGTSVNDFIQIFSFGVLMTLVMGVSESWRVSTRVRDDVDYAPFELGSKVNSNFYISGTNFATALFLPFFLLTFLHPATTGLYILGISILTILQFCLWFAYSSKWKYSVWSKIGIAFGLALPLLTAATNLRLIPMERPAIGFPSYTAPAVAISFCGLYIGFLINIKIRVYGLISPEKINTDFTDIKLCIALTGLAASFLSVFIALIPDSLKKGEGSTEHFYVFRSDMLSYTYLIIMFICGLTLYVIKSQESANAGKRSAERKELLDENE